MKKNIILCSICFLLFSSRAASAQDVISGRFGISFGIADNLQSANFINLPGIPGCCANFTSGDGSGLAVGLLYEYPITKTLLISARFGYIDHSSTLLSNAGKTQIYRNGYENLLGYTRRIDLVA